MEIVINSCFGGFGLSPLAELEYLKRKGKTAFFYKQTKYKHREGVNEYRKVKPEEVDGLFSYTFTKDHGDSFSEWPKSCEEEKYYDRDIPRDDADLVAVVKELGDKASGSCSCLRIVDIPDGISWEIDEYDGMESIHETHRSWS